MSTASIILRGTMLGTMVAIGIVTTVPDAPAADPARTTLA
jgi:hypothetical protein